jgi:TolB-like protein
MQNTPNLLIIKKRLLCRTIQLLLTLAALFLISGCSSFNCTRLENLLGNDTDLIKFSYTIADTLTQRAMPPLTPMHPDMPILVTTLVDNNNLSKTSRFGRILQEHIASRFVQLGFTVKEIKLTNTLQIIPGSGETILSRDLSLITGAQQAQAIFAGTVSYTNTTMYISTRIINPINSTIIATNDYRLCMDENILAMFGLQHQDDSDDAISEPSQPFLNSVF